MSAASSSSRWVRRSTAALGDGYGAWAILGLIAYGTYDFTNLATIKDWPVVVSVVDLVWGISLTAIAATLGYLITTKLAGE